VDWFNSVDATYRADLRELNELNFARFDAKLEQRLTELKAELRVEIHTARSDLVKWMFMFWAPTAFAVARHRRRGGHRPAPPLALHSFFTARPKRHRWPVRVG